ncbi:PKD repeat protein [Wenyingzhuangia heitensis]|uniref:PKD repeat protein n=1 Tax=Wenyingzhuangia heitensis TaxID=1487859 RepID=A0ABX0UDK6_9FLAO|nr:choice-of-anchor J domain-containing protein [Wenyingzhuangia heitensis]NIJ45551.1 PKD repeat protein [Wenyingzhuangia heitensis]
MKQNYTFPKTFILLFFLFSTTIFAQSHDDHNDEDDTRGAVTFQNLFNNNRDEITLYENEFKQKKSKDRAPKVNGVQTVEPQKTSVPIHVIMIKKADGTGNDLTEADIDYSIGTINTYFNEVSLDFFRCDEITYILDDDLFLFGDSGDPDDDEDYLVNNGYIKSQMVNLIVTDLASGNGYAYYPGGRDIIAMDRNVLTNGTTISHEMGHFFGLQHTHNNHDHEDVSKRELIDGSNCSSAGDGFCDTPADPNVQENGNVDANCMYTGTITDANGATFNPDTRNLMSYSRRICRDHFSAEQQARMYAIFTSNVRGDFVCPSLSIDYTTDTTASCNTSLTVQFTDASTGATSWAWDFNNDGITDSTLQNPSYTFSEGEHTVALSISDGSETITKVFYNRKIYVGGKSLPYTQDFDTFVKNEDPVDNWTVIAAASNFKWYVHSGATPTNGTGPKTDASGTSSGVYMYTKSYSFSGETYAAGDVTQLISPCFQTGVSPVLSFKYHMYSSTAASKFGEFYVDVSADGGATWEKTVASFLDPTQDSDTDAYSTASIFLPEYANQIVKIRFRVVRGNTSYNDVAIDDVKFENKSTVDFTADKTEGICLNSLDVSFTNNSILTTGAITSWTWDFNNDGTVDSTEQNPIHTFSVGTFNVKLTVSNGSETLSKIFTDTSILVGAEKTVGYTENFNGFTENQALDSDGWTTIADASGYTWETEIGTTVSGNTGPTADGDGDATTNYMFTEASGFSNTNEAQLISPCVLLGDNTLLKFKYHLYSTAASFGALHVDISTDGGTTFSNTLISYENSVQTANADPFIEEVINLSAYANQMVKIRFRAVRGNTFNNDIAIDNVSFTNDAVLSTDVVTNKNITISPNPVSSVLSVNYPEGKEVAYHIQDMLGQRVLVGQVIHQQINVALLQNGVYFLTIAVDNKQIVKKFVKE